MAIGDRGAAATRPQNVGIKAIEIYFPSQFVDQSELEKHDGVSAGKYTVGLAQSRMAFCDDREDIYSIALTALSSLLRKYNVDPRSIGRLEVGTETILDKSKSVKTVLMQLFEASGNFNVEGVDTINACYGGTNALFNTISWIESSAWDGRDGVVVAGDIAIYPRGAARPTGGAGCVVMLVGPDAAIAMEPARATHMAHTYDFYKPDLSSEYAIVDGHYSLRCYTNAVEQCYRSFLRRQENLGKPKYQNTLPAGVQSKVVNGYTNVSRHSDGEMHLGLHEHPEPGSALPNARLNIDDFDYMCFHAPTCKLVSKSYGRLLYHDYISNPYHHLFKEVPAYMRDIEHEKSLDDKQLEKTFTSLAAERFTRRVQPSLEVANMCGNLYCGSLPSSLASLVSNIEELQGKRIGMFSYGSGLASSMFSFRVRKSTAEMREKLDLHRRLQARTSAGPAVFEHMCELREQAHLKKAFEPKGSVSAIRPGTYYLSHVDDMWRRHYEIQQ